MAFPKLPSQLSWSPPIDNSPPFTKLFLSAPNPFQFVLFQMNAKYLFCRKGKKRSKAAANAENLDSKEILESSFEKEKKVEVEEDEDKENLAAENLFGDPEVRGEDDEEDGKEEQQAVVSC